MTTTPPPPLPENLDDDAAVRAWIAATSKPGTPPPPPAGDPEMRRLEMSRDDHAAMILWFGLAGLEPGVTAAIDEVASTCTCGDQYALRSLPYVVANSAVDRLGDGARLAAYDALNEHLAGWQPDRPLDPRPAVERVIWRMLSALRDTLLAGEVDALRLRLVTGDNDFELRCRRAGLMATLAGRHDDDHLAIEALRAAHREITASRHGLTEHAVFCIAGPTVRILAQRAVSPDHFDALVRSELLAIDAAMAHPHARVGGIEP